MTVTLFCFHKRTTFPLSRRKEGKIQPPYVVCLDCGKEFPYDWEQMKVLKQRKFELKKGA